MRWIAVLILAPVLCLAQPARISRRAAMISSNGSMVGGASGPSTYYYTSASAANNSFGTGGGWQDWEVVTVAQAGPVQRLGFWCSVSNDETVKMALYDSSSNLVSGASGTIVTSAADNGGWKDITGLSVSIAAGTYTLVVTSSTGTGFRVGSVTAAGRGNYASQAYASFPAASLPAPAGSEGSIPLLRMFVGP